MASLTHLSAEEMQTHLKMYEYFGSFTRCLLSMFEITLANWAPICRMLTEEISPWFIPICLLHKITVGFAVLGVINGCILQETFKVAAVDDVIMVRQKKREAANIKQKMMQLFVSLDSTNDGE